MTPCSIYKNVMNNEWMLYTQHYPISGEFSADSLEPQVIVGFNKKISIYVVLLTKKIWVCSTCTKHHSLCNWEPVLLYISHFGQYAICVVQYRYIIWFSLEKYTAGKKKKVQSLCRFQIITCDILCAAPCEENMKQTLYVWFMESSNRAINRGREHFSARR